MGFSIGKEENTLTFESAQLPCRSYQLFTSVLQVGPTKTGRPQSFHKNQDLDLIHFNISRATLTPSKSTAASTGHRRCQPQRHGHVEWLNIRTSISRQS